jgi:hypothetical protein
MFLFGFITGTKSPRNRRKEIQKMFFFGYLYRPKYLIFGPNKIFKKFLAAFGTWYYLKKFKIKKLRYQIRGLPVKIKYLPLKNMIKTIIIRIVNELSAIITKNHQFK